MTKDDIANQVASLYRLAIDNQEGSRYFFCNGCSIEVADDHSFQLYDPTGEAV